MKCEKLEWDSIFFGLNIGKISIEDESDIQALHKLYFNEFDLVYIFAPHKLDIEKAQAKLVDTKVIYKKTINSNVRPNSHITLYPDNKPSESLYSLALQSGEYSRFKTDNKFPYGSYERLYRRWIENAVSKHKHTDVLCYYKNNEIYGMVTVSSDLCIGKIGLVSVDVDHRNERIGSLLLQSVDNYLFNKNIFTVEVATQLHNTNACSWYERNGFTIDSITDVYHLWLH